MAKFPVSTAGLPDGIFAYQKSNFGNILEGLGMDNVGIFYCHLVYFIAIWYILPFGIFYCHLIYFIAFWYILLPFGMLYQEKLATLLSREGLKISFVCTLSCVPYPYKS
jgi:hypothetical protein